MSNITPTNDTAWAVSPYPWQQAQKLSDALGIPLVAAMVLAGRGLTDPEEAKLFLDCAYPLPDPFLFAHMEAAVSAISSAIERGGRIVVHGDYDADGITATALMLCGLRDLGVEAEWYLPSRFKEGFGLSRAAVKTIADGGPALLITVDCGVNYPEEVALARESGLEVIVVDHHRPGPRLPECHVIHEAVGEYPHGDLCGVGLALKVMHALHVRLAGAGRETLPEGLYVLLDLVAVGTIADLAALKGENRNYVQEGLKLIAIGQRVGLRALAAVSGCSGAVDSGTVAYRLAPRLNAAGRLADPSPPLRLLLTEDEGEATALAAKLHELNGARQDVERQILDEALEHLEALEELPRAIVLARPNWHEGVVGIVASRLVERYHRPTILLGIREGVAKGSGRSIPAYDLMAGLNAAAGLLTVYGGHMQAVGLTLEADRVDDFRRAIEEHAGAALDTRDLTPVYHADAILRGVDVNADTAKALAALGPFGSGNPRPRLLLVGADIQEAEATRNGEHLRCMVEVDGTKVRGIGFGLGRMAASLRAERLARLVGVQFRVDEWQGTLRPEFVIERIGLVANHPARLGDCVGGCRHLPPVAEPEASDNSAGAPSGATTPRMPPTRDLRDQHGLSSAVAQVMAAGEQVLVVACSVSHTLGTLRERMFLDAVIGSDLECVGRSCLRSSSHERIADARTVVVEWEAIARAPELAAGRLHIIVMDPPFRASHIDFLRHAAAGGATIHLCYGQEERRLTTGFLRYSVHPRFAMVCVYRAMQEEEGRENGVLPRARDIGWQEGQVVLTWADLTRARGILSDLGIERPCLGEAKLEARNVPAYADAEAEYEECSRLCLTL